MAWYISLARLASTCGVLLVMAGCVSSPPTQFIALDSTLSSGTTIDIGKPPLILGRIEIPTALDRPSLVRRTGPTTRKVSDTARWIAPLYKQIHQLLANDLAHRLGAGQFAERDTDSVHSRILSVSIVRFSANMKNVVRLVADWRVASPDSTAATPNPSGHEEITVRATSGQSGAIAAAMSRALDQFVVRVVTALKTKTEDS